MKKIAIIVILTGLVASGMALAADIPAIGYVDMRKVMNESKAGKRDTAVLEKLAKEKQAALQKEDQKLQALQQDFQKNAMILTDQQKQEKQKDFQGKVEAFKKMQADAQQDFGKRQAELTNKAIAEIKLLVVDLAREQKLAFVFEMAEIAVLHAEPGMDLTPKVIEKYDAKSK